MDKQKEEIVPADFFESPEFSLSAVSDYVWQLLQLAAQKGRYAFHTPVVAALSEKQLPDARVVVLREVNPSKQTLAYHTDYRSPKVKALKTSPHVHWTFYDSQWKLQLRVESTAEVHHQDEIADAAWEQSRLSSRRCYLAPYPPGSILNEKHPNLPEEWRGEVPDEASTQVGKIHFCKVVCHVRRVDWLYLNYKGNYRGAFGRSSNNKSTFQHFLAP